MKGLVEHWRQALAALVVLIVVAGAAYWAGDAEASTYYQGLFARVMPLQQVSDEYPLIAPLFGIRVPEAVQLGQFLSLKSAIQADINDAEHAGSVSRVSIYFRDLNTTRWIGINQNDTYYPASLLKVPVMIAYYKEAEGNPGILSRVITYQNVALSDPFDAPSSLLPGRSYTIQELINAMIISSDNGATLTLLANINQDTLADVYANLGINAPGPDSSQYEISTRTYGLFFRILYNATYLSPEYSQKALALLSRATFAQGLVAGLPTGTQVAHKFGEHVVSTGKVATGVELHDCGVVYYPKHPYLLCVMTSATDVQSAASLIETVSATTYAAVAAENSSSTPVQ